MILICSRNGKWVLNQLAPPFLIEVKSTGVWRGKWEWFSTQRWQKKGGGQAGFRVYAGAEQNQEGVKCAFPDTLTAFYLEIEQPYANAFPCLASKLWNAHRWKEEKRNMTCNFFLKKNPQRPALIVSSHTHGRMWYLTDRSTPAGLSLCLGCGLLATSPSSYRNAMVKRRIGESQGGAGPASILLLPYHLHRQAAAVCICTQKAPQCTPRFWSASVTD